MATCSTDGCKRPAARASQVHDGRICKVCYTKEWHDRQEPCSLWHCDRRIDAADLCTTHYNRKRRGVPDWDAPVPRRMKRDGKCAHKDGCPEPVQARGYCAMHYARIAVLGYADVGPVGRLKAPAGAGSLDPDSGYRYITVDGQRYLEHRYVMEQALGRRLAPGETVHHKHGVRDDNNIEHLELWLKPQPAGQRVSDLMEYIARYHADAMQALLDRRKGPPVA